MSIGGIAVRVVEQIAVMSLKANESNDFEFGKPGETDRRAVESNRSWISDTKPSSTQKSKGCFAMLFQRNALNSEYTG